MTNSNSLISFASPGKILQRRKAEGFTLVEAMVAIFILGLGLIGAFAVLVHSYAILRRTDEVLYVNRLLESTMEVTRNLAFEELITQPSKIEFATDYPIFNLYGKAVNPAVEGNTDYALDLEDGKGTIHIEKVNADLAKVTVNVTWKPFRLDESSRSVVSYISRAGINKR